MATFSYTKGYSDGATLSASHLTTILDEVETFLNTTKLNSDNIQDDSISSEHIKAGNVAAGLITSNAVQTQNIKDGAITKVKQAAVTVTNDGSNPGSGGCVFSAASGSYTLDSDTLTAVTNLSATITTTGRPVFVSCVSKSSSAGSIGFTSGGRDGGLLPTSYLNNEFFNLVYYQDTTVIGTYEGGGSLGLRDTTDFPTYSGEMLILLSAPFVIDTPAAGTYVYTVKVKGESDAANEGALVTNMELVAYEL